MKVALTGHRLQRLCLPEDETNKEWWQIGCDYLFVEVGTCLKNVKLHCILPCKN